MNIGKNLEIPIRRDLKIHISIYTMNCTEDISMSGISWRLMAVENNGMRQLLYLKRNYIQNCILNMKYPIEYIAIGKILKTTIFKISEKSRRRSFDEIIYEKYKNSTRNK